MTWDYQSLRFVTLSAKASSAESYPVQSQPSPQAAYSYPSDSTPRASIAVLNLNIFLNKFFCIICILMHIQSYSYPPKVCKGYQQFEPIVSATPSDSAHYRLPSHSVKVGGWTILVNRAAFGTETEALWVAAGGSCCKFLSPNTLRNACVDAHHGCTSQ